MFEFVTCISPILFFSDVEAEVLEKLRALSKTSSVVSFTFSCFQRRAEAKRQVSDIVGKLKFGDLKSII